MRVFGDVRENVRTVFRQLVRDSLAVYEIHRGTSVHVLTKCVICEL